MTPDQIEQFVEALKKMLDPGAKWFIETLVKQGQYHFWENIVWIVIALVTFALAIRIIRRMKKAWDDDETGIFTACLVFCVWLLVMIVVFIGNVSWVINYLVNPDYYIIMTLLG